MTLALLDMILCNCQELVRNRQLQSIAIQGELNQLKAQKHVL